MNRRIRRWAAKNKVEPCFTPTNAPWANPIEPHFGPRSAPRRPGRPTAGARPSPQREGHPIRRPPLPERPDRTCESQETGRSRTSGHQQINYIGLFHRLVGEELAQSPALLEDKGTLVVLGKDKERRAAADVGKVHVEGDHTAPPHLAAGDPEPDRP